MQPPARWLVELRQHPNDDVDILVRPGPPGVAPGPREVVWFGAIPLSASDPILSVIEKHWTRVFGPLRRTYSRVTEKILRVNGQSMCSFQQWEQSPRIANVRSLDKPGLWGVFSQGDFKWRPMRLSAAL